MDASGVPSVEELRWPILVALDAVGEDEILDLEARVADHLGMSGDARAVADPDSDRPLLVQRMMQAIDDLYQASAVEPDEEADVIRITDSGRRLTESDALALPVGHGIDDDIAVSPEETARPTSEKPSISDWVFAFLDGL